MSEKKGMIEQKHAAHTWILTGGIEKKQRDLITTLLTMYAAVDVGISVEVLRLGGGVFPFELVTIKGFYSSL